MDHQNIEATVQHETMEQETVQHKEHKECNHIITQSQRKLAQKHTIQPRIRVFTQANQDTDQHKIPRTRVLTEAYEDTNQPETPQIRIFT